MRCQRDYSLGEEVGYIVVVEEEVDNIAEEEEAVVDRGHNVCILFVLHPIFDPYTSDHSSIPHCELQISVAAN